MVVGGGTKEKKPQAWYSTLRTIVREHYLLKVIAEEQH